MELKRIFIVEDEAILLCDLEDLVLQFGYGLAGSASNLNEAFEKLSSVPRPDAALLDLSLNGISSITIADHLADVGVPIIFVSGRGKDGVPPRFSQFAVVQKPYDEDRLATALRQALGGTD